MKRLSMWIGFVAMLAAGCGSLVNHAQYQLQPLPGYGRKPPPVPAGDRETVRQLLEQIAAEFHLADRTAISVVPNVIVEYLERDERYAIKLSAWVHEGSIRVDIVEQPYTVGETVKYQRIRERVEQALTGAFGTRVAFVPRKQTVSRLPAE